MLASANQSTSALWHACADVAIATVAGGLVLLVLYPITWCAGATKRSLAVLGLRTRETQERAERQRDSRQSQHVAHS